MTSITRGLYIIEENPAETNVIIRNANGINEESKWGKITLPGKYLKHNSNKRYLNQLIGKVIEATTTKNGEKILAEGASGYQTFFTSNPTYAQGHAYTAMEYYGKSKMIYDVLFFQLDRFLFSQQTTIEYDEYEMELLQSLIIPPDLFAKLTEKFADPNDGYLGSLHLTETREEEMQLLALSNTIVEVLSRPRILLFQLIQTLSGDGTLDLYIPELINCKNLDSIKKRGLEEYLKAEVFINNTTIDNFIEDILKNLEIVQSLGESINIEKIREELFALRSNTQVNTSFSNELIRIIDQNCTPSLATAERNMMRAMAHWFTPTERQAKILITDLTITKIAQDVYTKTVQAGKVTSAYILQEIEKTFAQFKTPKVTTAFLNERKDQYTLWKTLANQVESAQRTTLAEIQKLLSEIATFNLESYPEGRIVIQLDLSKTSMITPERLLQILTTYLPKGNIDITLGSFNLPPLSEINNLLGESIMERFTGIHIQSPGQLNALESHLHKFNHLERLSIQNASISPGLLHTISQLPHLSSVSFTNCHLSDSDLDLLTNALPPNRPEKLSIKMTDCLSITPAGLERNNSKPSVILIHPYFAEKRYQRLISAS
jgi:hypothetical protein